MPAYKDNRQGTWYASFYFENWQGVKQKKLKRGFVTKKDALAWEREFLLQQATVDPAWLGMSTEGYVFAALIYWIFCFSMSRYSQHLEKRFNTGRTPH